MANSPLVADEICFVREAVCTLCHVGAAYALLPGQVPTVVSPLSVAYRSQQLGEPPKKRLIFNGMYINRHIERRRFVYEHVGMTRDLLEPGGFMWSCDLSSGYYHVELHPDFHQYVAFCLDGIYYQFAVMPFGLSIAPYVFTRITRELAQRWRAMGVRCISYIDDFIFFGVMIGGSLAHFVQEQARVQAGGPRGR